MERLPRTTAILERGIEQRLHLGGQAFVSIQGRIVADTIVGEGVTGRSLDQSDLMLWLSSTKPLTAIAIAQQHERGGVGWNEPVMRYLPEFGQGGKESITIRHLLMHTAGFRSADRIPDELPWDETIAQICAAPLEPGWIPGRQAGYQIVSSWFILAEIVRRLDGRSFDRYVRDEIFLPLGMNDSWIGIPPERFRGYADRIAPMYATDIRPPRPIPLWNTEKGCAICRPASNGRGPIRELGRFYEWLLHPEGMAILKPETVRELVQRHRVGLFDHTFQHVIDWGLGFIINSNRWGAETVPYGYGRYASPDTFGHSGAQSSSAFADPVHELVVTWALNGMPGERAHQKRAREINSALYEDLGLVAASSRGGSEK